MIHWRMRRPGRGELGDVIHVEAGELGADARVQAALLQELAVRLGGGGKAARAPARRGCVSEPIISPREAFLPPTVSTSRMPSCSNGMTNAFKDAPEDRPRTLASLCAR